MNHVPWNSSPLRVRNVVCSLELIAQIATVGFCGDRIVLTTAGIPPDALIFSARVCPGKLLEITFVHPDFDLIQPGMLVPIQQATFQTISKEIDHE